MVGDKIRHMEAEAHGVKATDSPNRTPRQPATTNLPRHEKTWRTVQIILGQNQRKSGPSLRRKARQRRPRWG
ncbi:hypothetical protein GCM10009524_26630 [Spirilliplanes yamanashiensis]